MSNQFRNTVLWSSLAMSAGSLPRESLAGPLDWLFGRPAPRPVAAYYPVNAYYPTAVPLQSAPVVTQYAPTAVPALAQPVPTVTQYAPVQAAQPSFVQVPVTYYRPVTAIDPTTGNQVTLMQPCTAYEWQTRAAPVAAVAAPTLAAPAYPAAGYPVAAPAYPTGIAPSYPTASPYPAAAYPASANPTSPYGAGGYPAGAPAMTMPGSPAPAMTAPGASAPAMTAPGYVPPAMTAPGANPADVQPHLKPALPSQPAMPSQAATVPPNFSAPSYSVLQPGGAGPMLAPAGNAASTRPVTPPKSEFNSRPIPDPDRNSSPLFNIPSLLKPRDRTAGSGSKLVPAVWPEKPVSPVAAIAPASTPPSAAVAPREPPSDGGWISSK